MMPPIIGIDLGSTNSLVSFWDGEKAVIIPNALGESLTPSAVSVDEKSGDILIGASAKDRLITHPHLSAALFKRYMGSSRQYRLGSHVLRPEDLSSLVLRALKADAEAYLGETVEEAVISVPAYFSEQQRRMTQTAGTLAGLKVERLINEPTAAAICYGLHQSESRLLVFDLGGGTFDVSVLEVFDGVIEVNATAGHNALGGEDFVDLMVADFLARHQLSQDALDLKTQGRLRWHAEQLKRHLSQAIAGEARLQIAGQNYLWQLDRAALEQLALPLLQRMRLPVEQALNDARISPRELDSVVLVGGATRMPLVRALCAKMLGKFPVCQHDPDLVVAMGAAIQAGLKARHQALDDVVLTDVCPYSLGLDIAQVDGQGHQQSGYFSPVIERNTVVPVSREQRYTTCADGQTAVSLRIYQGESRRVANNIFLDEMSVEVPPGPAGSQAVDVRFTYDINGLLEVQAEVTGTGQKRSAVIQHCNQQMTDAQIAERLRALEHLKIHPREQAENIHLMARGERLFEQSLGDARHVIAAALRQFEQEIDGQDPKRIRAARKQLREQLNQIESARM